MASLEAFPTELLLLVTTYLPPSACLSLRLSSKNLFLRLPSQSPTESKNGSLCESHAVNRIISERALLTRNQRRCILCNGVHPIDFFIGSTPICRWHEGWFLYRCIPTDILPAIQAELQTAQACDDYDRQRWIAVKRVYCAHERNILSWHVGECACGCESCGWWEVTCYIRVSPADGDGEDAMTFNPPPLMEMDMKKATTTTMRRQWRIRNPGPWVVPGVQR